MQDHAIAGLLVRTTVHRSLNEAEAAPRRTRTTAARALVAAARRLDPVVAAPHAAH